MNPQRHDRARFAFRFRRVIHSGAALLAVAWALTASTAGAVSFRGLEETSTYDRPRVFAVNPSGDQIVGEARPLGVSNPKGVATFWDEDTHRLMTTGPSSAGTKRTRAVGQETSDDGLVRRTYGWTDYSGSRFHSAC